MGSAWSLAVSSRACKHPWRQRKSACDEVCVMTFCQRLPFAMHYLTEFPNAFDANGNSACDGVRVSFFLFIGCWVGFNIILDTMKVLSTMKVARVTECGWATFTYRLLTLNIVFGTIKPAFQAWKLQCPNGKMFSGDCVISQKNNVLYLQVARVQL